ncbi:MAG TPA: hypothetical protein VGD56_02410 [Gemmatirosa sp.]
MAIEDRTLREGVTGGLLAAAAVAIWFLIIDTVGGHPFGTPLRLGESVASFFGGTGGGSPVVYILGYTLFHVVAFTISGLIVSAVVNRAEAEPSLLFGLLILFVAFELGWYGLSAILSGEQAYGSVAWYQVMVANLIAAATMGFYMYRRHPALLARASDAVSGGTDGDRRVAQVARTGEERRRAARA